jgi:hypothetical protein
MVGDTGIEPVTPSMSTRCSSAELIALLGFGFRQGHAEIGAYRPNDLSAASFRLPSGLGRHHLFDLGDQFSQVERL